MMEHAFYGDYDSQVTCINQRIAELEARRDALLNGYCFTVVYDPKPYLDAFMLYDINVKGDEKDER